MKVWAAYFFVLSFFPLLIFAFIAILNAFTFPRLRARSLDCISEKLPFVSILIPVRNEAPIIADTIRSLQAQNYPHFEILLLDDESTDGSAEIILQAIQGDPRLRLLRGTRLPAGWLGKPWACQQLSQEARGEYLLFTDADVRWKADALHALIGEAESSRADLLTVWPTQVTVTWGERLVVPLMAFSVLAYLPALAVHHTSWPVFAAAMGQCMLFRREAYQTVGGHAAIGQQVLDDMAFARAIKRQHLRLRTADANGLLETRMYHNWSQVRNGYAKNILAGHGNSVLFLLFSTLFHWWQFVLPWLCLILSLLMANSSCVEACILFILLGIVTRALTAATSRQRAQDAVFMPASVLLMTIIALHSIRGRYRGNLQWKGRNLS